MRMKPEHAKRLYELFKMEHLSPRSYLILVRRIERNRVAENDHAHAEYRAVISSARAGLPFTAARVASLEEAWGKYQDSHFQERASLAGWLRSGDDLLIELYGFDGICDLLNVNPVHRDEAKRVADKTSCTISAIAFICALEDSASTTLGRNKTEWNNGPLFHVFHAQFAQILLENPGIMSDAFAPGGHFYGVPTYIELPDGTMVKNPPALTVHNPDGTSKVVRGNLKKSNRVPRNGGSNHVFDS